MFLYIYPSIYIYIYISVFVNVGPPAEISIFQASFHYWNAYCTISIHFTKLSHSTVLVLTCTIFSNTGKLCLKKEKKVHSAEHWPTQLAHKPSTHTHLAAKQAYCQTRTPSTVTVCLRVCLATAGMMISVSVAVGTLGFLFLLFLFLLLVFGLFLQNKNQGTPMITMPDFSTTV